MSLYTLFLGSGSKVRHILLEQARIPFKVVDHTANESLVAHTTLQETVVKIARLKMDHVVLPAVNEGDFVFVLTADSMGASADGLLHGKPKDREDAIKKLHALSGSACTTATGFCIEKRLFSNGIWHVVAVHEQAVTACYEFHVPNTWLDRYLRYSWGMKASGAIAVEFYGMQFLQSVTGSYSAIMGLPLFEVREALERFGFFEN